jgi:hypothetical protein
MLCVQEVAVWLRGIDGVDRVDWVEYSFRYRNEFMLLDVCIS